MGTQGGAVGATATTANALGGIDTMLDNVSRMRSYLGAVQNGLESKIEFLRMTLDPITQLSPICTSCSMVVFDPMIVFLPILTFSNMSRGKNLT